MDELDSHSDSMEGMGTSGAPAIGAAGVCASGKDSSLSIRARHQDGENERVGHGLTTAIDEERDEEGEGMSLVKESRVTGRRRERLSSAKMRKGRVNARPRPRGLGGRARGRGGGTQVLSREEIMSLVSYFAVDLTSLNFI